MRRSATQTIAAILAVAGACSDGSEDPISLPPFDAATAPQDGGRPIPDSSAETDAGTVDARVDWFGDSDWYCCTIRACDNLCDGDEVPTTNGVGTYFCAPDLGQCE